MSYSKHTKKDQDRIHAEQAELQKQFLLDNKLTIEYMSDPDKKNGMLIWELNGSPVKYTIFQNIYTFVQNSNQLDWLIKAEYEEWKDIILEHFREPIPDFRTIVWKFMKGNLNF